MMTGMEEHQPDKLLLQQVNAAFRFVVEIDNKPVAAFTECTLPVIEWDMEELKEGGVNTYVHHLPGQRKPARITLKNGVSNLELWQWCKEIMQEKFNDKTRRSITVKLRNSLLKEIGVWHVENALPVRWTGPQLQTDSTSLAIQTLEFICGEVTVEMA